MISKNSLDTNAWNEVYKYIKTTNPISTSNIYSSMNSTLIKTISYPYVLIYPPLSGISNESANGYYSSCPVDFLIEVYHVASSSAKALKDEVVAKLLAGKSTLSGLGLKKMEITPGDTDAWEEGKKKRHRISFNVSFRAILK